MRKISFKLKITLWYTILMAVLVGGLFVFLLSTTRYYTVSSIQDELREVVTQSAGAIEFDDNGFELDDDFEAYDNGIYVSVWDENGEKLFGTMPSNLKQIPDYQDDTLQQAVSEQVIWYFYDLYLKRNETEGLWIRGIASQAQVSSAYHNAVSIMLIVFPVFILLAGILGYFLTSHALQPVRKISRTAQKIADENDLSIRIPDKAQNPAKRDEFGIMTHVFNQMLERLEQAFENEKQFSADASHELRTPVTVIISEAECAIEKAESLNEAKESLMVILHQGQKMAGLITQLLMLSRAETGKSVLDIEEVNLSELAEMVAEELQATASNKNITIETEVEEGIYVLADEALMMRLWINLVSNAIQYGREGGKVKVGLSKSRNEICGYVKDNGIGISKEHQSRIWERFYQVDPARSAKESGSMGLGLSMVKWIVESHGGSISLESQEGKGSVFIFILPLNKNIGNEKF